MNASNTPTESSTIPGVHPRAIVAANVSIGKGCTVASGAVLCSGLKLEVGVGVGPNAVFVDAESPSEAATQVQKNVRIGANATIYPGITLAAGCVVRPGSVVTRSVPPKAIVDGNPATIVGYVGTSSTLSTAAILPASRSVAVESTRVRGVTVHTFPVVPDLRGHLTVGEFTKNIPFAPLRYFMVFGVPSREVRGEHAHKECHQFLICVRGSCAVVADDGTNQLEVTLDAPNLGIYLPPMVWGIQYKYSPDALLLVFASHHYDPKDYIRDYGEFNIAAARGCDG